jgi:hypothetical protein
MVVERDGSVADLVLAACAAGVDVGGLEAAPRLDQEGAVFAPPRAVWNDVPGEAGADLGRR